MKTEDVIGVIPAAGTGSRLGTLPCSKEMLPVGFVAQGGTLHPMSAGEALLRHMRRAGVLSAFIVIQDGKWDIPRVLGDGERLGMRLAYVMRGRPYGPPYSLDQAYPFVREQIVAFGFPDILVRPDTSYLALRRHRDRTEADVVLGLYPAYNPEAMDMVELDAHGRIARMEIKPQRTSLQYAWVTAIWSPTFTEFLHDYTVQRPAPAAETAVGQVLQAALEKGLRLEGVPFPDGAYLDIGTPASLAQAMRCPENWGLP